MSWHFSRALEAEFLAAGCLDGVPSVQSSMTSTRGGFSLPGKTMEALSHSQYGTTFKPSTEPHGVNAWILLQGASHAKTSVQPEGDTGLTESAADYGKKWPESLARLDPNTRLWKTRPYSQQEDYTEYLETLPQWGIMLDGECWALDTPEHLTLEKESGLWPTPRKQMQDRPCVVRKAYRSNLEEYIGQNYPETAGSLVNPLYAEWMMGWPIGYTGLGALETGRFRQWLDLHGAP